jgi:hypothetical protein
MSTLAQRINRAAESILENEALTSNLDDEAAQALISWGVTCARMVARSTAGLDDAEAEDATSQRLSATRRLMRGINRWIPKRLYKDAESNATSLAEILDQAAIVYGADFTALDGAWQQAFMNRNLEASPAQLIANLRVSIEDIIIVTDSGGGNDQEKFRQEIN